MSLNKDDIVICINNGIDDDTIGKPMLTLNKKYVVIKTEKWYRDDQRYIIVKNDVNINYDYYEYRFINLSRDRKMKLDRLNNISKV